MLLVHFGGYIDISFLQLPCWRSISELYLLCLSASLLTWWVWPAAPMPGWNLSSACLSSEMPQRFQPRGLPVASVCASWSERWKSPARLPFLNTSTGQLILMRWMECSLLLKYVVPAPILWTCRCLSISPRVGLVPRHLITVIRSLASILLFCFLSYKEKHSLNSVRGIKFHLNQLKWATVWVSAHRNKQN